MSLSESLSESLSSRRIDGREMLGILADLGRDFQGTVEALKTATPEQLERRATLAEHCGHRVELRRADGTVAARGDLLSVTIAGGCYLVFVEAGTGLVPLAEVATLVRLQARQDAGVYPIVRDGGAR